MAPKVDPEDLIGAAEVAEILGLSQAASVATYRRRYGDFPPPVVHLPKSRISIWLRSDVERWDAGRTKRRGRPVGS
jgi:predicted DNA-binding transcriptional regulator AlpA